jgi:AcrR family transcriptional regulator
MGRPREHDDSTRLALLDAAEQHLSRGDSLSVRSLAEAAGTTTRAVYSLFGSMDGLHQALFARGFDDLFRRVDEVPETDDPAEDLVQAGLEAFRGFALAHPNLFRLGFERMVPALAPTAEAAESRRRALVALHTRVKRCQDAGLLGDRAARDVTLQFHALCQGLTTVEQQGWFPAGVDPERMWRDALGAFVAGLATDPKPRARQPEPTRTPNERELRKPKRPRDPVRTSTAHGPQRPKRR